MLGLGVLAAGISIFGFAIPIGFAGFDSNLYDSEADLQMPIELDEETPLILPSERKLEGQQRSGNLFISIALDKNTFKQGEKVPVKVKLTNVGPTSISAFRLGEDLFDVIVYDSVGQLVTYVNGGPSSFSPIVGPIQSYDDRKGNLLTLKPGESIIEVIEWDQSYILEGEEAKVKVGEYLLQGVLTGLIKSTEKDPKMIRPAEPGTLKSELVMIRIVA